MLATERPQYPLDIVRRVAERNLTDLAAHRSDHSESYWVGLLRSSLQQMLDATAEPTP